MTPQIEPEIRLMSECSLTDAVNVWNEGFKGYFADMSQTVNGYLARIHNEGISPEFSLIAFHQDKAIGFLLSGIRENQGKMEAWNGGTGVVPEYRATGIGKVLVKAALQMYREKQVDTATLEAITQNERAIKLYRHFGYETVDRLVIFQHEGELKFPESGRHYSIRKVTPHEVGKLDFYQHSTPWQTQWQNLTRNNGEALIVVDHNDAPAAYALYRKLLDAAGAVLGIALFQCQVRPGCSDAEAIALCALREVYGPPALKCRRSTSNLSRTNELVCGLLENVGFTTFVEQFHMVKKVE